MYKSIQKIIDIIYRNPKSKIKHYQKFGGYFNLKKIENARREMEKAAFSLTPVQSYNDGLPIYFLTGKKYLYQTLYCIQSLAKATKEKFRFYLIDDGSFTLENIESINVLLPNSIIHTKEIIQEQIDKKLPIEKYPYLHHKRAEYPHIKKLTDVHIFEENPWKLVLDSDMLFWQQPDQMINWLKVPSISAYMLDCGQAYGYSLDIMEELVGEKIKPLINVGAIGLRSEAINWEHLEKWCIELEKREGVTYFLEQALSAMLVGDKQAEVFCKEHYIVNPYQIKSTDILHHYVDASKQLYFKTAWKNFQ